MRAAVLLLLLALVCRPAAAQPPAGPDAPGIPAWAAQVLASPGFASDYALSPRLDPSVLHGDFDGDGRPDVAVLVERRDGGAQGIAMVHAGSQRAVVLGAGNAIGNGGDDFSWMDAWRVQPKDAGAPGSRGDALHVEKREAASALVVWDGAAYRWRQQGD
jgi:hypothetical protein